MAIASSCPGAPLLERLRLGQLSIEEMEQFAQHVEQCGRCAAAIEALQPDDTLVDALRAKSTSIDRPEGAVVANLQARLKQLRPLACSSVEATAAFSAAAPAQTPAVEGTQEVYDFLAPPRGPGEVGWLGPYRILKVLGVGGMGVVFQAEDPALQRLVALKAMKPAIAADGGARKRFLREAQTAAAVKNDHVVTIYQVGEDRGVPYLAMEFLEGEPLDGWLKRGRQPNLAQLLRMGREMALGLAAAHERGLIHRDIKPGNIWLEMPKGRVKLLDFGLARATASDVQVTQSGAIVGTPADMAPEQARGEKVDHRCDLFSLGCVLYRLATGAMPFKGGDTMSVLMSLAMDTPRPPRQINAQLPPALGELIEKLLAKDPADRPASAKAVVQALQTIERASAIVPYAPQPSVVSAASSASASIERTITSAPVPHPYPSKRRHRLWGAIAAGLLVLLGSVVAVAIIFRIKTPDGQTTEMRLPEGTTVEVGQGKDAPPLPKGAGPLGRLDPAKIPAVERFEGMPKEVVAVLGENRGGHRSGVWSVALSPDGKLAASASLGSGIVLWDAATMRVRAVLPGGLYTPDGKNSEALPGAWRWEGGDLAFAPDGNTLAVSVAAGASRFVIRWDVATDDPQEKGRLILPSDTSKSAISADGHRVLTGGDGKNVSARLWDVRSGEELKRFEGHAEGVRRVALSRDGHRALCVDGGGMAHLWDVDSGKELHRLNTGAGWKGYCTGLAFSPDGKRALSCSDSPILGPAKLWDVETGKLLATYRDVWNVGGVAFTPDGSRVLLAGGGDSPHILKLLDLESGQVIRRFKGHMAGKVSSVVLFADGRRAISCGEDRTVRLWDVESGKELLPRTGHTGPVTCCDFSPDGKTLASTGTDITVRLWDLTGAAPLERVALRGGELVATWGNCVTFSPDGRTLAASFELAMTIPLWNLTGNEPTLRQKLSWLGSTPWVTFAGNGTLVGWEHTPRVFPLQDIFFWDVSREKAVEKIRLKREFPAGTHLVIHGLAVAPDSKTVAMGFPDGIVELWDLLGKDPKKRREWKAHKSRVSLAFDPLGKKLATCGVDDSTVTEGEELAVKLWDLSGEKPTLPVQLGHHGLVPQKEMAGVSFARDGKLLASWGPDGTVAVWDVAVGKKRGKWKLPGCRYCALAPDSRYLAVCMDKGAIYILRLDLPSVRP